MVGRSSRGLGSGSGNRAVTIVIIALPEPALPRLSVQNRTDIPRGNNGSEGNPAHLVLGDIPSLDALKDQDFGKIVLRRFSPIRLQLILRLGNKGIEVCFEHKLAVCGSKVRRYGNQAFGGNRAVPVREVAGHRYCFL